MQMSIFHARLFTRLPAACNRWAEADQSRPHDIIEFLQ